MPYANPKVIMCQRCLQPYPSITSFYKTAGYMFTATGHLPICKDCVKRLFNDFTEKYGGRVIAFKRLCMALNIYYDADIFADVDDGSDTVVGVYLRRLAMKEKGKTFDDSLADGFAFDDLIDASYQYRSRLELENAEKAEEAKGEPEPPQEEPDEFDYGYDEMTKQDLIERWGDGFEPIEYRDMANHEKRLRASNPKLDVNQELFIDDLCYTYMIKQRALRNKDNDAFNKASDNYRRTFKEANFNAAKTVSDPSERLLGVGISIIENYTPAEYYKNKKLFNDIDGIGQYIERHFLRPLKNLVNSTEERDPEYQIVDPDEVDA